MEFRILGPIEVFHNGHLVHCPGVEGGCFSERFLQARGRMVRVVVGKCSTSETWQIAGETIGEVGYQRFPGDVAVVKCTVDQDQRWPLSVYSSGDLGAVCGDGSMDAFVGRGWSLPLGMA